MTDIGKFENKHEGERIFLIGNGPSLNETPLEELSGEYTMGLNRIDHIYDETEWRPSFYLTPWSPKYFKLRQKEAKYNFIKKHMDLNIPCFIRSGFSDEISGDNVNFYEACKLRNEYVPFHDRSTDGVREMPLRHLYEYWSDDASILLYEYHAMYVAVQLAAYMGFSEIYFVGTDLGLEYNDPHMIFESGLDPHKYQGGRIEYIRESIRKRVFVKSATNAVMMKALSGNYELFYNHTKKLADIISVGSDHSDYFSANYDPKFRIIDKKPVEKEVIKAHIAAKRICEDQDIDIYNATVGGELEIYERVDLYNILNFE